MACLKVTKVQMSGNHFKHTFSSIGPTGAEIQPVKGLSKILTLNDAGSFEKSFQFNAKDGSTGGSTNIGTLFLLSKIHILVNNHFENINIINIKVSTDECFESSFSSIRTKMAEIEPIEELELLYTRNIIFNSNDRVSVLIFEVNASDAHASSTLAKAVPHAAPHVPHAAPHANVDANANVKSFKSI
jgi:hypothetical protein